MANKLKIVHNYIKYKNVYRFKIREDVKVYQNKGIEKLIRYLNKNSDYYHKLLSNRNDLPKDGSDYLEILKTLPIMDKVKRMDNFNDIVCVDMSKEKILSLANQKEMDIRNGIMLARLIPQMSDNHKIAFFQRDNDHSAKNIKTKKVEVTYFDICESIENNMTSLSRLKPDILIAPPSVLLILAEAIYNKRLSIEPIKVVSIDEVLEDEDRDYFIEQFRVKAIGQIYQYRESFLGYTCEHGTLHINEDVIIMEEEQIDEYRFVPIITDFTNLSQPIVRYRLNDILVHKKETCPCGCQFMALEKIEGSEDDIFVFTRADSSQVKIFPDNIRQRILCVEGIKNYEVIQLSEKDIQVNLEYDKTSMFALSQKNVIQQKLIEEFQKVSNDYGIHQLEIVFEEYNHIITEKMKRVRRAKQK